jgi:hypothetical protein
LLYTKADFKDAAGIGKIIYITSDLGRQRWQEMFSRKRSLPDGRYQVPITVPPPYNIDLDGSSSRNQDWNIRTLTLMSRAGLISIDAEPPPQQSQFDSEADFEKAIEDHRSYRTIQIRDEQHLKAEIWDEKVEPARNQRQRWADHNFNLIKEALGSKRCLSDIFSEAYSIPSRPGSSRRGVPVERSCGGCPFCRQEGTLPFQGATPAPFRIWQQPNSILGETLKALLNGENLLGIFYSLPLDRQAKRDRKRLIPRLVKEGIVNVVAPESLYPLVEGEVVFWFDAYQPLLMPKLPTLLYYDAATIPLADYQQFARSNFPLIVFLPDNTPDPTTPHRLIRDVWPGRGFRLEILCAELSL